MKFSTKIKFITLIIAFLNSCSHQTIDEKLHNNLQKSWNEYFSENFITNKEIEVFVITNRQAKTADFGCSDAQFGINLSAKISSGSCKISVPKNHQVGEIPLAQQALATPESLNEKDKKDKSQSPSEVFRIGGSSIKSVDEIIAAVKKTNRTPLVFVHGFNVKYQEALLRAAQIAYDLKYQGPVILFSWPAGAEDGLFESAQINKTYENNLNNAKKSITEFQNFLLALQKNKIKINLIVHSMGHQVVLPVLTSIGSAAKPTILVHQLILNAPDFSSDEFKITAKDIKNISNHITLYCSNNDRALQASRSFNNNQRAGACVFAAEIDTVDVSKIDNSVLSLGHSYYSSREVLGDIFLQLIGMKAEQRLFITKGNFKGGEKYLLRD